MTRYWSRDDLVRYADSASKPARLQEIIRNVQKLLNWKHREGGSDELQFFGPETESALIVVDTETSPVLYNTVAGILPEFGIEPTVSMMRQNPTPNAPLPDEIVGAMKSTDLLINMATYTISHSTATVEHVYDDPDTKYLLLADPTEDSFTRGAITADPETVDTLTREVRDALIDGDQVVVTSPNGTDVEMSLAEVAPEDFHFGGYPLGETGALPMPLDEMNGTIVHDNFMMGIGLLEDPITWEVESGWITEITGGVEAQALEEYIEEHGDENSYCIAEFAVMTNPEARPNGNYIENKMVGGGVHFALGDNIATGGTNESAIHLDGVQLRPRVDVDGRTILEEGRFDL